MISISQLAAYYSYGYLACFCHSDDRKRHQNKIKVALILFLGYSVFIPVARPVKDGVQYPPRPDTDRSRDYYPDL